MPDGASNYQKRKSSFQKYRKKTLIFYLHFSLRDMEAREWFERNGKQGAYLKRLILADKAQTLNNTAPYESMPDYLALYDQRRLAGMPSPSGDAAAQPKQPKRHRRSKEEMEQIRGLPQHLRYKETFDAYHKKTLRFSFQFSLRDAETREWFERRQDDKGPYLKFLILQDKDWTLAGNDGSGEIEANQNCPTKIKDTHDKNAFNGSTSKNQD